MRSTVLVALLTLTYANAAVASPAVPQSSASWTRIRSLAPAVSDLIEDATNRSWIVTDLLDELEQSDVVVYVKDSMSWATSGPKSTMVFVSFDGKTRYLLVRLDFNRMSPSERITALGHELQHVLEVAAAPEVRNAKTLGQLYRRIGWENERDRYETTAAQDTAKRVRSELSQRTASLQRTTS